MKKSTTAVLFALVAVGAQASTATMVPNANPPTLSTKVQDWDQMAKRQAAPQAPSNPQPKQPAPKASDDTLSIELAQAQPAPAQPPAPKPSQRKGRNRAEMSNG